MMDYEFKKTIESEYDFFFPSEGEAAEQHGFIGYLRGDYGRDGREFWTTWFDEQESLKTDVFRDEFDESSTTCATNPLTPWRGRTYSNSIACKTCAAA